MRAAVGSRKKTWPMTSMMLRSSLRELRADDVDADVVVVLERPGSREQERQPEQPPLNLEPGIGTGVEQFANNGIAGADDGGDQNQPSDVPADPGIHRIDRAAQSE